jgi:hypothetical protein
MPFWDVFAWGGLKWVRIYRYRFII